MRTSRLVALAVTAAFVIAIAAGPRGAHAGFEGFDDGDEEAAVFSSSGTRRTPPKTAPPPPPSPKADAVSEPTPEAEEDKPPSVPWRERDLKYWIKGKSLDQTLHNCEAFELELTHTPPTQLSTRSPR